MKERKDKTPKLVYDAHALSRIKERKIPKEVVRQIALYGLPIRTERIANWIKEVKCGQYQGKNVHVVVQGRELVKTVYWADEWEMNIRTKRHIGVKQA